MINTALLGYIPTIWDIRIFGLFLKRITNIHLMLVIG